MVSAAETKRKGSDARIQEGLCKLNSLKKTQQVKHGYDSMK